MSCNDCVEVEKKYRFALGLFEACGRNLERAYGELLYHEEAELCRDSIDEVLKRLEPYRKEWKVEFNKFLRERR